MNIRDTQTKEQIFNRYLTGEKVTAISAEVGIPKSTLYDWIRKAKAELAEQQQIYEKNKALDPREYFILKNHVAKLEGMLEIKKLHAALRICHWMKNSAFWMSSTKCESIVST